MALVHGMIADLYPETTVISTNDQHVFAARDALAKGALADDPEARAIAETTLADNVYLRGYGWLPGFGPYGGVEATVIFPAANGSWDESREAGEAAIAASAPARRAVAWFGTMTTPLAP